MNICLVSQHYPPETAKGGIGTQTWNKAMAFSRLGHVVHVLSSAADHGPALRSDSSGGITVHRLQPPSHGTAVYSAPAYWIGYSWEVLRQLRHLTDRLRFDVVDFPEYGAEGFAYQLDRSAWDWIPVVVQLHAPLEMFVRHMGWPEAGSEFHRVGSFMEQTSIQLADGVTACSANLADFVSDAYGIRRDAIDVVYTSVDTDAFCPGDDRAEDSGPVVLFVGNVTWSKGVIAVIDAVLRLRTRYPNIALKIAGTGDDGLVDSIRERIRREDAETNVELLGFVGRDALPALYQGADVFCSPAQYEGGVATVYLEAMACACPVVAGRAGGASEAVQDGETGILVDPIDAEGTAAAIDRILSDPDLKQRMGRAGRRRAEEIFSTGVCAGRMLHAYERAIARSHEKREATLVRETATT